MTIAILPMYDFLHLRESTDAFWAAIRQELTYSGIEAPAELTNKIDIREAWQSHNLVFGQTCGMPFRTELHDKVELIATPDYGLPDCPPGYYYSEVITRASAHDTLDKFMGRRFVANSADSESGYAAMRRLINSELDRYFMSIVFSGSHINSIDMVGCGRADVAAIDAVSMRYIREISPEILCGIKTIAKTSPTPGLPYIASKTQPVETIKNALKKAIENLSPNISDRLGLRSVVEFQKVDYLKYR